MNSSLSLGHVPKPFKLVIIKPLIKKPKLDPCELVNYKPISNLPLMSKMLEKVGSAHLSSLLQNNYIYEEFVLGPAIAQKLHLLNLQMTCFLRQTKAASHC